MSKGIIRWILTELHGFGRPRLTRMPLNLLPQLKALQVHFRLAFAQVASSCRDPSRDVHELDGQPSRSGGSVKAILGTFLKRDFKKDVAEELLLGHRQFEDPLLRGKVQ